MIANSYEDYRGKSQNRAFDKVAHAKYDATGKIYACELAQSFGYVVTSFNSSERLSGGSCKGYHDLVLNKKGHEDGGIPIDVEVRSVQHWEKGHKHIVYPTIDLPMRKFRKDYDTVILLITFSHDGKGCYIFNKARIAQELATGKIEIVNKFAQNQKEPFAAIPKNRKDLYDYITCNSDGSWKIHG